MFVTEAQEDIDLLDSLTREEVWLYVNPLTGRHAKMKSDGSPLAVFLNENIGRAYELKSEILKGMIGYYALWEEMLSVASEETSGKYDFITVVQ